MSDYSTVVEFLSTWVVSFLLTPFPVFGNYLIAVLVGELFVLIGLVIKKLWSDSV